MKLKFFFIILIILAFAETTRSQTLFKISGNIYSNNTNEPVSNASIQVVNIRKIFNADTLGRYNIELKAGIYTLAIKAIGFKTLTRQVNVNDNLTINFKLLEITSVLNEVVISQKKDNRSLENPQMGSEKLSMNIINNIPVIFGERDVLKTIQLLPGVKSAGEGGSGFYVRGGSSDQNLILMDDVPVYNSSHLLGFFSTFNPDVIEDVTVYKTGMPANFGGRLSSVLEVNIKQPSKDRFKAGGGIGLITSKLTLEGPISKGKSSFLISGRRTYVDALLRLSPNKNLNQNILYFYDLNGCLDFSLGQKTNLNFSGYFGSDKFGISDVFSINWGNKLGKGQLKHIFSNQLSSTTTLAYTSYQNKLKINTSSNNFQIFSKINDLSFLQNFIWQQAPNHTVKFGFNSTYHKVTPGEITTLGQSNLNPVFYQKRYSLENAVFTAGNWQLTSKLNLSAGLRLNGFSIFGPGNFLTVDPNGNILEKETFAKGQVVKTYFNLEPRLALSYLINDKSSIKASYVRNSQNMHLISNSTANNPTDKWLPSSKMIKPELSNQYAIGYYRNLFNNAFEFNAESYYKTMQNQIDYRDGANVFDSNVIETQLLYGIGRAYGLELLLKKKAGNFTGWLGYTLSKTERKIDGINNNKWYNARQDRTHDISVVAMYKLNKKWSISASWIYYTGDAITLPTGKYSLDGQTFLLYSERNGNRMPAYHRLDFGVNLQLKQKKRFSSELSFSLYNAFARKNAYSLSFRESETRPDHIETVQTTLFKLMPSISYNFKFL